MGKKAKKATKKFQRKELGKEIQKRRAHKIIKGQREKATKQRRPDEGNSQLPGLCFVSCQNLSRS